MTTTSTPAPGAHDAGAPNPPRLWDVIMRHHQEADAAYRAYKAATYDRAYENEVSFERDHGVVHGNPGFWEKRAELHDQDDGAHRIPDAVNDEIERLTDAAVEAEDALMAIPAPDHAALCWKLDKLLEAKQGGCSGAWSEEYIRQTVADYRRLLGEARHG